MCEEVNFKNCVSFVKIHSWQIDIELKNKDIELKNKDIELRNKDAELKIKDIELKIKDVELKKEEARVEQINISDVTINSYYFLTLEF